MKRLLPCLFCLVLILAGCGKETQEAAMEKKIEEATGGDADVDLTDKGITVKGKTEEGKYEMTAGDEAELPEDFPDDVYIYGPSRTVMTMKVPEGHSVTLSTKDDKSKVLSAYKKEMTGRGWSEEGSMDMGISSMLMFEKGERATTVTISTSDTDVLIVITVGEN